MIKNPHTWSGWPGAYCRKCGCEDPSEIAMADGAFDMEFDGEGNPINMTFTPPLDESLLECPVIDERPATPATD